MDRELMEQAIQKAGTPFYLFQTDAAVQKIQAIKAALGPNVDVCYAMKANPFLVGALAEAADYLEVCSPGEFRICERAGVPAEKIVLSGVNKEQRDLESALSRYGARGIFTVESVLQWNMLCDLARAGKSTIHVLLRLTSGNQFGLDREEIVRMIRARESCESIEIDGIQFYSGTQKKSAAKFQKELQRLDEFLLELQNDGFHPQKLEYGPGFPVDYFGENPEIEDKMLGALADAISNLQFSGRVVLELGREIAATCGSYVTKVVDVKSRGDQHFCIVDGGMHQLNYYGQLLALKTPPVTHWDDGKSAPIPWTVFGSLCTANDVLVKEHPFSELRLGSRLVFECAGAYSMTEGMSLFLSRDLPQILLYSEKNGFQLARDSVRTDTLNSVKV